VSLLDGLRHRLHVLFRGEDYARDIERELRFHVELETLAHANGADSTVDAELAARRAVGNMAYYREETRSMTLLRWQDRVWQDGSYALRGLKRSPGFTAMVAITLALGFGVNAAMYSLLDRVFRREPAAVVAPPEVRRLYQDQKRLSEPSGRYVFAHFTYPHFRAIAAAVAPMKLGAFTAADSVTLVDGATRIPARESWVTQEFFEVLGLRPAAGRFFAPNERRIETPVPIVVISDAFWHRSFNGDRRVIGRTVAIDHKPFTIVGVAPPDFTGVDLDEVDMWTPASNYTSCCMPGPWYASFASAFDIVARPGSPREEARLLSAGTAALRSVHLEHFGYDSTAKLFLGSLIEANGPMRPADEVAVATRISWISIIVLLIACANVTNLLLLRGSSRTREIAVRRALGVSRARLYEQLTVESTLLSVLGGAIALIVAFWCGAALRRLVMPRVHWASAPIDIHTIAFLLGLSLLIGITTALAPAAMAMRTNMSDSLKAGSRDTAYKRSALRAVLLVLQTALCVVLVAGAGLFLRSLSNMRSINLGYDLDDATEITPVFASEGMHLKELASDIPQTAARLSLMPDEQAVAYASVAPLAGMSWEPLSLPDRDSLPTLPSDRQPTVNAVSTNYFRAVGVPVVMGRAFAPGDAAPGAHVVIVSQTMAHTFWPGMSPIGKCLIRGARSAPCDIVVGVARDAHRMNIIEQPIMQYYVPASTANRAPGTLIVRTPSRRAPLVAREAERVLKQLDPTIDGVRVRRMADIIEPQLRPWRLGATLFTAFGLLALAVAGVGIYSVVAYGVSQRTSEMGIRVALGARTSDILDLVLADGLRLLAVGLAIGLVAALALGRFVSALLFGVVPYDPSILIGTAVILCLLGMGACAVPGWRAARIDPAAALRAD
jgi:putative ABC transport system permease protein